LTILSIERELTDEIDFDDVIVISEFAARRARKKFVSYENVL